MLRPLGSLPIPHTLRLWFLLLKMFGHKKGWVLLPAASLMPHCLFCRLQRYGFSLTPPNISAINCTSSQRKCAHGLLCAHTNGSHVASLDTHTLANMQKVTRCMIIRDTRPPSGHYQAAASTFPSFAPIINALYLQPQRWHSA